ncbi:hypothetical protein T06_1119 [Trichinella sp. T6]|nr:hypothetical protein T06_4998 [Trichinella sp. T6]KRX62082.1 hypothetical protein T06_9235 [Trichinella sp. T6]KRX62087.1 hypothetical protein T06_11855 [Trichinella sp. T6]KRX62313.1 hypothetical protein T06_1119 [Trichinella sp. T6]
MYTRGLNLGYARFDLISRAGKSCLFYDFVLYVMKNPIVEDPLPLQPESYVLKLCETLPKNRNYKLFLTTTIAHFWNYS